MKSMLRDGMLGLLLAGGALGCGLAVVPAPAQAMPVFDSANYAQNLLTAARTLQQINQQVQSLQNEAAMLQTMQRNLGRIDFPQLSQLQQRLGRINSLMGQAQGVDFRVETIEQQLRQLYPDQFDQLLRRDHRAAAARARLDAAMASYRRTMGVQSQIVANVQEDAQTLSQIVARSQGAEGALAAQQATNQLLALTAQQQMQIQTLLAAQYRGQAMEQAERVQAEREAREAVRRFLGDGRAYTPRRP
ncbi:MAG TPA: P-type conjugative transfer protein TrbJ [Allosphingosinicella sp.]|nr:P-type conjugative transfer protein TrbJ [Allosphingosinicella sp.]